jgi:alkanesulfonate monooxygenase SsuD/methylene tetrahydromethanopterin reductase-like flavin-dependent oxidoreductase (luciferase family)
MEALCALDFSINSPVRIHNQRANASTTSWRKSNEKVERMSVFGDPAYCRDRVRALREEFGMDEFIGYFNQGGLIDHAVVKRSMELFAREVIPHCR